MAETKLNGCGCCAKFTLCLINVFYLLVGLGLFIFGIFLVANENKLNVLVGMNVIYIPIGFAVTGLVIIATSIIGLAGAGANLPALLGLYCFLVFGLLCVQIGSGVVAIVFKDRIEKQVDNQFLVYIHNYTTDTTSKYYNEESIIIVDIIQGSFQCCGLNGLTDWLKSNPLNIPDSCECLDDSGNNCELHVSGISNGVWKKGCNEALHEFLQRYIAVFIVLAILLVGFQVLIICCGVGLCACILSSQSSRRRYVRLQNYQSPDAVGFIVNEDKADVDLNAVPTVV